MSKNIRCCHPSVLVRGECAYCLLDERDALKKEVKRLELARVAAELPRPEKKKAK